MKTVNHQVIKEIERVADELQINKLEAARSVQRNFLADGLLASAEQAEKYIMEYRPSE